MWLLVGRYILHVLKTPLLLLRSIWCCVPQLHPLVSLESLMSNGILILCEKEVPAAHNMRNWVQI